MKFFWRMLRVWGRAKMLPKRAFYDVSRIPLRVHLNDLDVLRHMNNGTYLTVQDLGRFDFMLRTGLWQRLQGLGWSAVVARQTISYRKSLHFGDRYLLETRYLGLVERNFVLEHRFVRDGEICAQAFVVGRFVNRNGAVSHDEVEAAIPEAVTGDHAVPEWVVQWLDAARVPSSRRSYPSEWHRLERDA